MTACSGARRAGTGLDPRIPIDRDHLEQARRTKEPGWVEAEPQVLMLPGPVREAVLARTLRPGEAKGVAGRVESTLATYVL